ncbi:unnamed protein product [Pocillopora meandrina]|uniref:MOSC domain-containing protein n=1 Tax=Pocillopora meandrina TaxID=46732 RepID=A0AAU9X959_9CNID|nr:unnamed protein product [Pocillopora meandrina]
MAAFSKYLLISVPVVALAGIAALWWQREKRERSYIEVGRVSSLIIYPVKSCKGIRVDNAKCFKEGMEYDRRWILLDENDIFISQRVDPKLALVVPHFEGGKYLCLDAPGMKTLKLNIDLPENQQESKRIRVYRVYGGGQYVGDEAAEWFSSYLKRPGCKLYKLSQPKLICEDEKWGDVALPGDKASFGNFSPFMITTEQSLVALNGVLPSPVTMERFRPNVVVDGLKAYDEDNWTKKIIKIGDVEFRFLKNCGRCSLTTVNPATGEKEGNEPLATLQRIRLPEDRDPRQGRAPLFGVQFALDGDRIGVVRIGDIVMVSA